MNYLDNEKCAYEWFKHNHDSSAVLAGGYNANESDIYSPKYEGYIEIKMLMGTKGARCGQFTMSTIENNPYAILILNGDASQETLANFVKHHYEEKQVKYFIVGDVEEGYRLLTMEDFIKISIFSIQSYAKRSGTSSCPKKYQDILLKENTSFYLDGKKIFCRDDSKWGEYLFSQRQEFFISEKCNGEVRKCSNTKNLTYHIEVRLK